MKNSLSRWVRRLGRLTNSERLERKPRFVLTSYPV